MVVEPTSMATPRARSWKPGQTAMTCLRGVDGDRHLVAALRERRLEGLDDVEVGAQAGQRPLALERLEQPAEVAGRRGQLWRHDLDVVESDDGIDRERPTGDALAHDLTVDLALWRHVDHDVAEERRGAGQAAVLPERRARQLVLGLDRARAA